MATFDQPSELVLQLPYPTRHYPRARSDSRNATLPAEEENQLSVLSHPQGNQVDGLFYFIEPRPRNPWAAIGSLTFLSALVLAAVIVPLLHTDPLPKREMLTMLYLQPPAAAGSAAKFRAPTPVSTPVTRSNAISAPVHTTQQVPETPAVVSDGVPGGVAGGVVGGIPGGLLTEVINSTPHRPVLAKSPEPEPVPVKRMRIASRIAEANLIHDVPPQYPTEAGRARIEGTVVLMAVIGKDGTVQDVRVESGLPMLAQAAIDAVKQWRYKPYLIDGQPVEVDSRITINFTLSAS